MGEPSRGGSLGGARLGGGVPEAWGVEAGGRGGEARAAFWAGQALGVAPGPWFLLFLLLVCPLGSPVHLSP